jgi:hypothetical protein
MEQHHRGILVAGHLYERRLEDNCELLDDFKDGGGGHLVKWLHTFGVALFGLSIIDSVCAPNLIKLRR